VGDDGVFVILPEMQGVVIEWFNRPYV
jgi:hypothetical protein